MITNRTYLNYIKEIALLFCNTDNLCKAGVESRLKNNLTNDTFEAFLSNLNSRKWYFGNFDLPMTYFSPNKVWITGFNFTELLSGQTGRARVEIPANIYNQNNTDWKKIIEYVNRPFLKFENIVGDKIIFSSNEHSGYGIAFVPSQPQTGQTGQTTSTSQPGTITVQTQAGQANINPQTGQVTATQNFKLSDFDFQKLIIPGVIVLGFLLARKFKVI